MQLTFAAIAESKPGIKWQTLFNRFWPAYKAWFLSRGGAHGPSLTTSLRQLRRFMPEIVPNYERLVDLAGGDELAARFLCCYRPPAYLSGCSQAVYTGQSEAMLIRNYDLAPELAEGVILHSAWNGRKVIAINECLWGADDGLNDAGLALSITYGGRKTIGDGFGIPLIARYILEFCETTADAAEVLRRVPSHMAYNVTVLDRRGDYRTAYLHPNRPPILTRKRIATNHQEVIDCHGHAQFTATLEREQFLNERLVDPHTTSQALKNAFLRPPLFNRNYANGFGTLYTAIYYPERGEVEYRWSDGVWVQSFKRFREGIRRVRYCDYSEDATVRWTDTPTTAPDGRLADIFRQVSKTLIDALYLAKQPGIAGRINALIAELERTGQVPWEKLGTIWIADHREEAGHRS